MPILCSSQKIGASIKTAAFVRIHFESVTNRANTIPEVRGNKVWIFINKSNDTVSAPARPAVKPRLPPQPKQQAHRTVYQVRKYPYPKPLRQKQQAAAQFTESRSIRHPHRSAGGKTTSSISWNNRQRSAKQPDGSTSKTTGSSQRNNRRQHQQTNKHRFPQRQLKKSPALSDGCIRLCQAARHQTTQRPHHRYAEKPYPTDHDPTQFGCSRL